ncbi:GIY-YIG nuclease family protein [candidate division KSB1 bacterium]|nr:GIY-YIG nuclease family protein [candidate division KSB1 bacterium]
MIDRLLQLLQEAGGTLSSTELAEALFKVTSPPAALAEQLVHTLVKDCDRVIKNSAGQWSLVSTAHPGSQRSVLYLCKAFPERCSSWQAWQGFALVQMQADGSQVKRFATPPNVAKLRTLLRPLIEGPAQDRIVLFDGFGNQISLFRSACRYLFGIDPEMPMINFGRVFYAETGEKPRNSQDLSSLLGLMVYDDASFDLQVHTLTEQIQSAMQRWNHSLESVLNRWLEQSTRPAVEIDFSCYSFDLDDLRLLPTGPGVYRFYDRSGDLLYVGKARNLSARIGSYFVAAEELDDKVHTLRDRLYRIETEPVGSELEALLLEQEWIENEDPPVNRQLRVRKRLHKTRQRFAQIVLLPSLCKDTVRLYLLRPPFELDTFMWAVDGSRRNELKRVLETFFFSTKIAKTDTAAWRMEIATSWLSRHAETVSRIDMRLIGSAAEAVRLVQAQAENVVRYPAQVAIYR